jgi:hypothetical protein
MKSGKSTPKNNAARARNTRGKKSGMISKKEADETAPPVSMKEENSLQAMQSKIQREMDDKTTPEMQKADDPEMQKAGLTDDVQKADNKEMK